MQKFSDHTVTLNTNLYKIYCIVKNSLQNLDAKKNVTTPKSQGSATLFVRCGELASVAFPVNRAHELDAKTAIVGRGKQEYTVDGLCQ